MNNNTTAQIVNIEEHRPIVIADIENGYDRLAHTLTNALMVNKANLTAREMQVVFAIISKTYRFQKKEDWIANSQICELTQLSKGHVSNLKKSLLAKNVIYKNGNNTGINKVVSEWKVHNLVNNKSSQPRVPEFTTSCTPVHNLVNKSSQPSGTHKKEIITKEIITKEKRVTRKRSPTQKQISLDTLPDYISSETIQSFIEHRKTMKKPFTDNAFKLFVNQLIKHHNDGYDTTALMEMAIMSNWQMVYPKPEQKRQSSNSQFGKIGQSAMDMMNKMEFN